jgi:hypothetical protein
MADWVGLAVTAILGLAGLYFANSLRHKTRAEVEANVAEKRFDAYARLWVETKVASPMRGTPLTPGERSDLYKKLTDWYYDDGNGMLLTEQTRNIYLKAKKNLTCCVGELVPDSLAERAASDGDARRGQASIDQLSLLRTSMRADLRIYTEPYDEELSLDDVAFLRAANVDLTSLPWKRALARQTARQHAPIRDA